MHFEESAFLGGSKVYILKERIIKPQDSSKHAPINILQWIFPILFSSELSHHTHTHTHTHISNSLTQFLQQITLQVREKCKTILEGAISFQDISPQYNLYFLKKYICFRNMSNLITANLIPIALEVWVI